MSTIGNMQTLRRPEKTTQTEPNRRSVSNPTVIAVFTLLTLTGMTMRQMLAATEADRSNTMSYKTEPMTADELKAAILENATKYATLIEEQVGPIIDAYKPKVRSEPDPMSPESIEKSKAELRQCIAYCISNCNADDIALLGCAFNANPVKPEKIHEAAKQLSSSDVKVIFERIMLILSRHPHLATESAVFLKEQISELPFPKNLSTVAIPTSGPLFEEQTVKDVTHEFLKDKK